MPQQKVLVLSGEDIGDPEVLAMLQAFYSRSPMAISDRLVSLNGDDKELKEDKIKAALNRYYVGYGHQSIGDCGTTTVFIENVSMLVAKVIQDDPLYNGQECSTRYLDFSKQPFLTACSTSEEEMIQSSWRRLYMRAMQMLPDMVRRQYTEDHVLSHKITDPAARATAYDKTVLAISFDYARGLLPCGATTSLAWTSTLRRMSDRCKEMMFHPLDEVRSIARRIYASLLEKHPNSFRNENVNPSDEFCDVGHFYSETDSRLVEGPEIVSTWYPNGRVRKVDIVECMDAQLPRQLIRREVDTHAYFNIRGGIDFGSFRDIQRHRNGLNQIPIVGETGEFTQHSYYLNVFEDLGLSKEINILLDRIKSLGQTRVQRQYLLPMATLVQVSQHWNLGQMRYVTNIRSKTSVHPTVREWTIRLHDDLAEINSDFARYCPVDRSSDYLASDRGEQTIKEKS